MEPGSFATSYVELGGRDLFLFLHTVQAPSQAQWAASIEALNAYNTRKQRTIDQLAFLAVTDGAAPDAKIRDALAEFLHHRPLRVAVITESALLRGAVLALNHANPEVKTFAPHHWLAAMSHIRVAETAAGDILDELMRLQAQMDPVRTLDAIRRLRRA